MARLGRPARLFSAALVAAALCATAAALAQQSAVVSNLNGPQPVPPPLTRLLQWHSWDGQQVCSPRSYTQPTSEAEIVEAVQRAAARGHSLKVVGSGHSFSAIALGDDPSGLQGGVNGGLGSDLLNLDYYRAAELDAAGVVTVQAGIRVFELNTILDNANRALPNLGAVSTCVAKLPAAVAFLTAVNGFCRSLSNRLQARHQHLRTEPALSLEACPQLSFVSASSLRTAQSLLRRALRTRRSSLRPGLGWAHWESYRRCPFRPFRHLTSRK